MTRRGRDEDDDDDDKEAEDEEVRPRPSFFISLTSYSKLEPPRSGPTPFVLDGDHTAVAPRHDAGSLMVPRRQRQRNALTHNLAH